MFKKKTTCPPTTDIVLLLADSLSGEKGRRTQWHLSICDFCGAEAELLLHHSPQPEHIEIPMMPKPLRRLAESLLAGRFSGLANLAKINDEINALG